MAAEQVPEWTLGWRLRLSLDHASVAVEQMADELGVSRSTVSRWLNDRGTPSRGYLTLWAQRTRVPRSWLTTGQLPRVDSNHQPADTVHDLEDFLRDQDMPDTVPRYAATASDLHAFRKALPIGRRALLQSPQTRTA